MNTTINFADPNYEPTDEDLFALSREAFAGIKEARERSREEMRLRIQAARKKAVLELLVHEPK